MRVGRLFVGVSLALVGLILSEIIQKASTDFEPNIEAEMGKLLNSVEVADNNGHSICT